MLFSIVFAGVRDLCKGDIGGRMLEILPFYSKLLRNVSFFFLVSHGGYQRENAGTNRRTSLIIWKIICRAGSPLQEDYEDSPARSLVETPSRRKAGRRQRLPGRRTVELMPIRAEQCSQEGNGQIIWKEVFSTGKCEPGKTEDRAITRPAGGISKVTEEELQGIASKELLTV